MQSFSPPEMSESLKIVLWLSIWTNVFGEVFHRFCFSSIQFRFIVPFIESVSIVFFSVRYYYYTCSDVFSFQFSLLFLFATNGNNIHYVNNTKKTNNYSILIVFWDCLLAVNLNRNWSVGWYTFLKYFVVKKDSKTFDIR